MSSERMRDGEIVRLPGGEIDTWLDAQSDRQLYLGQPIDRADVRIILTGELFAEAGKPIPAGAPLYYDHAANRELRWLTVRAEVDPHRCLTFVGRRWEWFHTRGGVPKTILDIRRLPALDSYPHLPPIIKQATVNQARLKMALYRRPFVDFVQVMGSLGLIDRHADKDLSDLERRDAAWGRAVLAGRMLDVQAMLRKGEGRG